MKTPAGQRSCQLDVTALGDTTNGERGENPHSSRDRIKAVLLELREELLRADNYQDTLERLYGEKAREIET